MSSHWLLASFYFKFPGLISCSHWKFMKTAVAVMLMLILWVWKMTKKKLLAVVQLMSAPLASVYTLKLWKDSLLCERTTACRLFWFNQICDSCLKKCSSHRFDLQYPEKIADANMLLISRSGRRCRLWTPSRGCSILLRTLKLESSLDFNWLFEDK